MLLSHLVRLDAEGVESDDRRRVIATPVTLIFIKQHSSRLGKCLLIELPGSPSNCILQDSLPWIAVESFLV